MLSIGLTGGIAAGKSLVAARLAELGAVLIDADVLAREVVEPGSAGLAEVVQAFGEGVIASDGGLDRPRLGELIFDDPRARERLNAIVHPRVRARAAELRASAPEGAIVVQDIPLLVETGQGPDFHLVIVVDAPESLQISRMTSRRGLSEAEARGRLAAQAARAERLAAADIVIDNSGTPEAALETVEVLWQHRLLPFAQNLAAGERAERSGPPALVPYSPQWPAQARRLVAKVQAAVGGALPVDHIGSTSVPGLDAKDVIDLQLRVPSIADVDALAPSLAGAGFPRSRGIHADTPKTFAPDPEQWQKAFHANADPGRPVNLHVRVDGSPGADYALAFRDWLRVDPQARDSYLAEKRRLAEQCAADPDTSRYAEAKEPWLVAATDELLAWKERTGWRSA
ncbi:dephospho-CoA kinase [Acaricomes phytoseiuli]|uniref:dephospho-CoA kinase n=1 Tax=Acaricomes phytoseiuli TaxID=291968 RepID=UPI00035D8CCA|nr:dephospho-CoA kinase [Acaricomes phytoseiuli]MCW1249094.1 dephospho-CoA kinase [Acaricomes phytoseiuli]